MWFIDIDGCVVKFNIQQYVGQISLFSNDAIRDMEYIIACVKYTLKYAKEHNVSLEEIDFLENQVLRFVKEVLYERLRENRDCFLEYDNLEKDSDRVAYIEQYKKLAVDIPDFDITKIMEILKKCLHRTWLMIELECQAAKLERRKPNLPFSVIDADNDIISVSVDGMDANQVLYERPVQIARSAYERVVEEEENYANMHDKANMRDNFMKACSMVGPRRIVDYDRTYCIENINLGSIPTLRYIQDLGYIVTPLSHHTGERETRAKTNMFKRHLPFIPFFGECLLKYHPSTARMNFRRGVSVKAERAMDIREKVQGVRSLDGCYLIDDSMANLIKWAEAGGNAILFRPRTPEEIATGVDKPVDSRVVRMFSWSSSEIDRVIKEFEARKKKTEAFQYTKIDE